MALERAVRVGPRAMPMPILTFEIEGLSSMPMREVLVRCHDQTPELFSSWIADPWWKLASADQGTLTGKQVMDHLSAAFSIWARSCSLEGPVAWVTKKAVTALATTSRSLRVSFPSDAQR